MKRLNFILVSFYGFPYTAIAALRVSLLANFLSEKGHNIFYIKADNRYYNDTIDDRLKLNEKIIQIPIFVGNRRNSANFRIKFTLAISKEIKKIIKNHKIDFIFFCSDPFWYLPLGAIYKKLYKIPYVIDFRDIMYRHPLFELNKYKDIGNKISDKLLEKLYIKHAALIIDVTEENTKLHQKIYSKYKNKFITIKNGYDPAIIELTENFDKNYETKIKNGSKSDMKNELKNELTKRKLKLTIAGKFAFYNPQDIDKIIEIEKIDPILAEKLEVIAIGKDSSIFKEKSKDAKIIYFNFQPQIPQIDLIKKLKESDILLLNNFSKTALGTKVFDYIGLNKPVFAFVKKDYAIWKLLQDFENSFLIENSEDLIKSIYKIIDKNIRFLTENNEKITQYSRNFQFEKLKEILIKTFS